MHMDEEMLLGAAVLYLSAQICDTVPQKGCSELS